MQRPETRSKMTMAALSFKITGPARRGYMDQDTDALRGQLVTSTHPDLAGKHYLPTASSPPIPCKLPDGAPCWVRPIYLQNP